MEKSKDTTGKNAISRADFIKKTAIATAGFYIVPRFVLGGKGYTAPSDKLYIAAVGTGGEAENDIHHFATAPKKNAEIAFSVSYTHLPDECWLVELAHGPKVICASLRNC